MPADDRVRSLFEHWLELRIRDGHAPDPIELCRDQPELVPSLRSLIERYQDLDGVLPSPSRPRAASEDLELREPPRVENYEVLGLLGVGGMGEAWEAEQSSPVRRRVALKVIKRGADTAQVVSRFSAERQALAAMEHPAIAKVFDAGATEDGRPYFAMELVRGEPIDRFADRQRLTIRQRLDLFASVCDGVQHAHQKGLIHRDLKPSNILVSLREESSASGQHAFEPKLIDFGIAKAITPQTAERSDRPGPTEWTALGQLIGTPDYMSPEQADRSQQDIDTRSDVYALGLVLYKLLVGVLPFAHGAWLLGERRDDAPPPSARFETLGARAAAIAAARQTKDAVLVKQLRGEIDWILGKALAPDREMRYTSAAQFADDLRRSLRDEPVSAGPPSLSYRLRKLALRHRVAVVASAIVLLSVLATVAGLGLGLQRALRAEAQATAEAEVTRRVSEFLVDAFRAGDPSYSGAQVAASDVVEQAANRIRQQLADEPEIRARLSLVLAEASLNLGEIELATQLAADGVSLSSTLFGEDDATTGWARNLEAYILMSAGRLDDAEARFRSLLDAESRRRPGGLLEAKNANDLGILLQRREELEESEGLLRQALAIYRAHGMENTREAIRTRHNLAYARRHQGATEEAADILRDVLARQRSLPSPPKLDIATTLNDLASATRALGDLEGAESLYREALEQRQQLLSSDHPDVAQSLNNVGSARFWAEDYDQAAFYMQQAYDIWQRAYGGDHPRLVAALSNLAAVSGRGGRFDQAEDYHREALAMTQRLHGPDHFQTAVVLRRLGDLQMKASRHEKAIATLEKALDIFDREPRADHPQRVTAALSLATALRATDRASRAERLLRELESTVAGDPEQAARVREALAARE